MRKILLGLVLGMGVAGAAMADPVFGNWRTEPDDNGDSGLIRIEACGDKICGTLVKAFDASGAEKESENIGKKIVWDMVNEGDGAYGGGKIWAPDRDKVYASKMQLQGDKLAVSGCVLGGLICRNGGNWTRQ